MKKKHSITIAFLGILLAFSSCGSTKILSTPHDPDASIIIISSFTKLEEIVKRINNTLQLLSSPIEQETESFIIFLLVHIELCVLICGYRWLILL